MYDNFLFLRHGNTMQASEAFVQHTFGVMALRMQILWLRQEALTQ